MLLRQLFLKNYSIISSLEIIVKNDSLYQWYIIYNKIQSQNKFEIDLLQKMEEVLSRKIKEIDETIQVETQNRENYINKLKSLNPNQRFPTYDKEYDIDYNPYQYQNQEKIIVAPSFNEKENNNI